MASKQRRKVLEAPIVKIGGKSHSTHYLERLAKIKAGLVGKAKLQPSQNNKKKS